MLERFKEGIEIAHKKEDSTEKKNKSRRQGIEEHFENNFTVDKNRFVSYLEDIMPTEKFNESVEKLKDIDFEKANPSNNAFVNELRFAGESFAEGFLDCFMVEKNNALDRYMKQLQMIERKVDGKSQYYVGAFKDNKLIRATPYQKSKQALLNLIESRENKLTDNLEQKQQQPKQEQQLTRSIRKED